MTVYYINLALILVLAVPLCIIKPAKWKKFLYLCATFGWMWCLGTFRQGIGFDYNSYILNFTVIRDRDNLLEFMRGGSEPGYVYLTKLMSMISPESTVVMYGIYTALILIPVVWFIYKYCDNAWLSTWLFVTLVFFHSVMNFIRQSFAVSILLFGYKFLREKRFIPFLMITLLAASFHKSALIMILVYFFCHIKMNKKWVIFLTSATLVGYLTSEFILSVVLKYIFTTYMTSTIYLTGLSPAYLFTPACVLGTCLALYHVWKKRDEYASLLLNLMIYSMMIWVFVTRHFILERFAAYMFIYAIVAVPAAVASLRAFPEDIAERDRMKATLKSGKAKPGKEAMATFDALDRKISDSGKYYWSAVAAVLLITFFYHEFGATSNFHGIFPYVSIFDAQV